MDTHTQAQFQTYVDQQEALGLSAKVLSRERAELTHFWRWATAHHHLTITPAVAAAYQTHLADAGLAPSTVRYKLARLKRFYQWRQHRRLAPDNPFGALTMPQHHPHYQRQGLSESEITRLMATPDLTTINGVRVRAILETFYSTGLRELELARLTLYDLDHAQGWVRVDQGKHRKDRMVPIGRTALYWLQRYLDEGRPEIARDPDTGHLFLSGQGHPYRRQGALSCLVRRYFVKAGIAKPGACHLLRHSAATHMLNHGADIRHIQAFLGHRSLRTTQGYTHLSTCELRQAQQNHHPWA